MDDNDWVRSCHEDMKTNSKFGRLTFHYEGGRVIFVKKEETLKPPPKMTVVASKTK